MSLDFSISTPTTAVGAGTPSRAISLTLTGSGTLGSTASFALSDGGAGGTFFPPSPVTIASGQTVGATAQFVYIPASGSAGNIAVTASGTGGLTATHALVLPINNNATVVVHDSFAGAASTALDGHSSDVGGSWLRSSIPGSTNTIVLTGSGSAMIGGTGSFAEYQSSSILNADADISYTVNVTDNSHSEFGVMGNVGHAGLDGYWFTEGGLGGAHCQLNGYINGAGLSGNVLQDGGVTISAGSHALLFATRSINGSRYLFCMIDGATITVPTAEGTLTGTHPGVMGYSTAGQAASNGHQISNYYARNADWTAPIIPVLTLSGPSSGYAGVASSNFAVGWSNISGPSAVVTPNDSNRGGTFAPASITTSGVSGSATFTYTPAGVGTFPIAIGNNQGYSEVGSPINYSAVAPSISLSGPTSGASGSASSSFTVSWSNISGPSAVVTPGDSNSGGTFAPASITTSGVSGSATFTYTPAGVGTFPIAIGNNQGYAETGSPISYTANAGPFNLTFPSANVFLSPYTWRTASGSAIANTSGAYLRFSVTGTTSVGVGIDITSNTSDMPTLKVRYSMSGGYDSGWSFVQAASSPGSQILSLASGLNAGSAYTFHIAIIGGQNNQAGVWASGAAQTKLDYLRLDNGSTVSLPTPRSKRALILGDSYLTSYFGGTITSPYYSYIDYTLSWGPKVARAMGAEFGQCGIGGSGWKQAGNGGYPAGPSYWNYLDSTHVRDFTVAPDYVFVGWGINDHHPGWTEAQVQAAAAAWLTAVRAAFPSAWIFVVLPFGGQSADDSGGNNRPNQVPITTAVAGFADAKVKIIDIGSDFAKAFNFSGASWASPDGVHASSVYHGDFAASIAQKAQSLMRGGTGLIRIGAQGGFGS